MRSPARQQQSDNKSQTAGHRNLSVLDLVEPVWPIRDDSGLGGDAELKRLKHVAKIGNPAGFAMHANRPEPSGVTDPVEISNIAVRKFGNP
jgi:hypothetical protein